jgi:hypothetical protein
MDFNLMNELEKNRCGHKDPVRGYRARTGREKWKRNILRGERVETNRA